MQQWEHQYVVFSNLDTVGGGFGQPPALTINGTHQTYVPDLNVFLTQVGDEGWEMVSMHISEAGHHHFAFKRPKQQESTPVASVAAAVPTIAQGVMARVEKAREAVVERFRGGGTQTEGQIEPAKRSSSIEDDTIHIDEPKDAKQGETDIPPDVAPLPEMFEHPATNSPDVTDEIETDTEKGETPSNVGESKPE